MLTREQNDLLTQTGRGTPCGELMRRYWQPLALVGELDNRAAPLPVRILGEDLVLFRDDRGQIGLLDLHCAHRGADLSYGRLEDGGLRCVYHGWLYDVSGRCLDQPGEPAGSDFRKKVRQRAYPCQERSGIIFTYMGPGEPPLLPNYDFLSAPEERRVIVKLYQECNYLQAHEGNMDQVHLSFLHRLSLQEFSNSLMAESAKGTERSALSLLAEDVAPCIETETTDFGMRELVMRKAPEGYYLKVENAVLPAFAAVPGGTQGKDGYLVNWHVPIDDTCHWKYMITFRRSGPLNKEALLQVLAGDAGVTPDGRLGRNKANRYLQTRDDMRQRTFAGLGNGFAVHDAWATETAGVIQDRTQEHLGYGDKSITMLRRVMFDAIAKMQRGEDPPHVIRDPKDNSFPQLVVVADVLPNAKNWKEFVDEQIAANRRQAGQELVTAG
ncbi:MAG TPA: Rieske 2Fe-2S domain-containing protein [Chloroflexota bacterium]|nr:Rieske 2Fe-2S domain-containing protein [Chloroflexota bacterium]